MPLIKQLNERLRRFNTIALTACIALPAGHRNAYAECRNADTIYGERFDHSDRWSITPSPARSERNI